MIIQLTNQVAKEIITLFNKEQMQLSYSYWNIDKDRWVGLGYAEPLYFDHNMYSIVKENNCEYLEIIEEIDGICTGNKERYELDDNAKKIVTGIIGG